MRKGLISVNYYIQLYWILDLKTWYHWYVIFTLFFLAISVCSTAADIFSLLSFITHSRFDRFAKTLEKCTRQRLRPAKQPFFRKQICEFTLEEIYPFYLDIRLFLWFFRLLPSLDICLHLAFSRGWRSTMICKTGNIVVSVDFYKL